MNERPTEMRYLTWGDGQWCNEGRGITATSSTAPNPTYLRTIDVWWRRERIDGTSTGNAKPSYDVVLPA